uniref:Uncharacterized protein n=1 Tax=Kalanchoe fedtschenkoi TaxID=63787 RepID=A0A7N0SWU6_KALFE
MDPASGEPPRPPAAPPRPAPPGPAPPPNAALQNDGSAPPCSHLSDQPDCAPCSRLNDHPDYNPYPYARLSSRCFPSSRRRPYYDHRWSLKLARAAFLTGRSRQPKGRWRPELVC